METWRDIARPIIAETIRRVGRKDMKQLRKALKDAYPFGDRSHHPYKIWLDEVKQQIGFDKRTEQQPELFSDGDL